MSNNRFTQPHAGGRSLPVSLFLSAAALLLFAVPGAAGLFQMKVPAVAQGELWRLITCHWTHWGVDHLTWDLSVFAGLGLVCEKLDRPSFHRALWLAALSISLGVSVMVPGMTVYRGLSGIDAALFALLACHLIRRGGNRGRFLGVAGLLGFIAKIVFEWATGGMLFVNQNALFTSVPEAHLIGAISGIVAGFPSSIFSGLSPKDAVFSNRGFC